MTSLRELLLISAICPALVAMSLGCSSERLADQGGTEPAQNIGVLNPGQAGSVGLSLTVAQGLNITSLSYTIVGTGFSASGTAAIGDAQSAEFVVGGIPAGSGYTIQISGVDSDNDPCSSASTPFSITAGAVTYIVLSVVCSTPTDATIPADVNTGVVAIEAGVGGSVETPFQCPGISSFAVSPGEVQIGQPAALAVQTVGPAATVNWSLSPATGAALASSTGAATTFTCSIPGTYVVTATLTLDGGLCAGQQFTTMYGLVNCEPQCVVATDCTGSFTTCSQPACVGGLCTTQSIAEGTPCSDAGISQICNGTGSCVPFTVDVVRIGNPEGGTLALTSAPVFIEQRSVTTGAIVGSPIALPTVAPDAGQNPFGETGTALGVGLARSVDGHTLSLVGYVSTPGSTNPANTATDPVVVARIDQHENVDTSTVLPAAAFHTLNATRSSVSQDGAEFWVSGLGATPTGGIWYVPYGPSDAGASQLTSTAVRNLGIFGGQLYGTGENTSGGAPELFTVGSGVPDGGTQTLNVLTGLPTSITTGMVSPWSFLFLDIVPAIPGLDTLYIANDSAVPDAGVVMGVQRWSLNSAGTSWSLTAVLELLNGTTPVGFRGLTGINVGGTATLIGSTAETLNRIAVFTDDGVSSPWAGTVNVIATAPGPTSVEFFRGLALPPH